MEGCGRLRRGLWWYKGIGGTGNGSDDEGGGSLHGCLRKYVQRCCVLCAGWAACNSSKLAAGGDG